MAYYVLAGQGPDTWPIFRFCNRKNGTHFCTMSEDEAPSTIKYLAGTYTYEGVAFYAKRIPPR